MSHSGSRRDYAGRWVDLGLPDADIAYLARLPLSAPAEEVLDRLVAETRWRQDEIRVYGRTWPQPRLTAWYGDPGAVYTYSGLELQPLPWTPLLTDIKARVEDATAGRFNSVLLNYYRNERDSMGLHSDDEPELGPEPVIASLSLGEQRILSLRHRRRKTAGPVRIPLESGSLLLMRGPTQRHWRHGIGKLRRAAGPRVNLTFRYILPETARS